MGICHSTINSVYPNNDISTINIYRETRLMRRCKYGQVIDINEDFSIVILFYVKCRPRTVTVELPNVTFFTLNEKFENILIPNRIILAKKIINKRVVISTCGYNRSSNRLCARLYFNKESIIDWIIESGMGKIFKQPGDRRHSTIDSHNVYIK